MKVFTIWSTGNKYRIVYRYKRALDNNYTTRQSIYFSKEEAQTAARKFIKRGYKLADNIDT